MTFVATLLRGLRARAVLSFGSVVLTALAIGAAMLGPIFAQAVTASYAVSRLDAEPNRVTGLSVEFQPAGRLGDAPEEAADLATAAVERLNGPAFAPPSAQLETLRFPALGGEVLLEAKQGACRELPHDGRCPTGAGETMISHADARYLDVGVGDRLRLGRPVGSLEVTGVYATDHAGEDFWFDPDRLQSLPRLEHPRKPPTPYRPAPLFVVPAQFAGLPAGAWLVRVDSRLDVRPAHAVTDLASAVDRVAEVADGTAVEGGRLVGADSNSLNELRGLDRQIRSQQSDARASITPATISLILIALALLLRLLMAAADLRLPELAIAGLRGMTGRRLWALGMAEPVSVIVLAIPCGAALGYAAALVLARSWLVPGLPVSLPLGAFVAPTAVVLAAVAVAAFAVTRVTRRPLAEQLSGARRPGRVPRSALLLFLVCTAVAAVLLLGGLLGATTRQPDAGDFLLPIALAAAAGLAATWLVAWLARGYARRHPHTRSMAGFLSARTISRRHEGTLMILPLTAALAIATFAIGVDHAAASWRQSAAATRAPAAEVWSSPRGLDETVALTHRLDPDGRWLMAAAAATYPEGLVSIVDTDRLARVSAWPDGWVDGKDAAAVQELLAPSVGLPRFRGSRIAFFADNQLDTDGEVYLHLLLEDGAGPVSADVGPFPAGPSMQEVSLPACRQGCLLRTVTIGRGAGLPVAMHGSFVLQGTGVDGSAPQDASALGLRSARHDGAVRHLRADDGAVVVDLDTSDEGGTALLATGGVGALAPVVVGADAQWHTTGIAGGGRRIELPDGPLDVRPVAEVDSLPFFGPSGVLVDYSAFAVGHTGQFGQLSDVYVLSRADTPAGIVAGLRSAELSVQTTLASERTALDDSAYALALRLYGVSAVLVLLMALAGLVFSTLVQLPARRRDAAALRVVGVRRRHVLAAVARELLVVLGTAAAAGVVAGLLAQLVVLRTLTLGYATELSTPEPSAAVDPLRLVVLVALTTAALAAVALLSAFASVRGARGATLRESAR